MEITDKKPALFEKTGCTIWTDPYIQRQMLREHLNFSSDGASRKKESIVKIIDFIISHTREKGHLLDLGCGPGLYTSLLADQGYHIEGIDFNKASIEYAIEKHKEIKYLFGDYLQDYPAGKYDAVIMIYCDLGTHSDNERDRLLKSIYNSLNEDGVFIFDVFTEGIIRDKQEGKSWEYAPNDGFWSKEKYLLLSQTFHYPKDKAFAYQYNLITNGEIKHFIIWDRYYSEVEIKSVLKKTGFRKVSIIKNLLDNNNFTSNSEIFVIAEK